MFGMEREDQDLTGVETYLTMQTLTVQTIVVSSDNSKQLRGWAA